MLIETEFGRIPEARSYLPRLAETLTPLYGAHPGFAPAMRALASDLAAACAERPPALRELDRARAADPGWFLRPDMLGYSAYVDRFGGTLQGVADRIPYLQSLGVRYLHLLPFWRARDGDNDGGFAVADYATPDPALGTNADMDELAASLREAGISLCADLVLNHTADDHPWALAARAGNPAFRDYYHVLPTAAAVREWEVSLGQVFPETAPGNFTQVREMGGFVWTTFYPYQWDLNYANPAVFAAIAGLVLRLANRGVEAFRLDSAAFLWKRLGTSCRSLPETHLILRALRMIVAIAAPGVLLKSEVIAPVAEAAAYLGTAAAPECHLAYHAGLMTAGWVALAEQDASTVRAVLAAAPVPPAGAGWVNYVRCHDDIGWQPLAPQAGVDGAGRALDAAAVQRRLKNASDFYTLGKSFARGEAFQSAGGAAAHGINGTAASLVGLQSGDRAAALARLRLLYGLAYAAGGVPLLFMGDELGQLNDDSFHADPVRRHEGRWLHRPMFAGAAAPEVAAIFDELRAARQKLPALSPATAPRPLESGGPALLAFSRGPDCRILCNFSSDSLTAEVQGAWTSVLGPPVETGRLVLEEYGMAWLATRYQPA